MVQHGIAQYHHSKVKATEQYENIGALQVHTGTGGFRRTLRDHQSIHDAGINLSCRLEELLPRFYRMMLEMRILIVVPGTNGN